MEKILFAIREYPSGRVVDVTDTRDDARATIAAFEEQDMDECIYTYGRYYITEAPQTE